MENKLENIMNIVGIICIVFLTVSIIVGICGICKDQAEVIRGYEVECGGVK